MVCPEVFKALWLSSPSDRRERRVKADAWRRRHPKRRMPCDCLRQLIADNAADLLELGAYTLGDLDEYLPRDMRSTP
jgi:hypothetical protein